MNECCLEEEEEERRNLETNLNGAFKELFQDKY